MLEWSHVTQHVTSFLLVLIVMYLAMGAPVQEKHRWISNPDENIGIHTKLRLIEGDIFIDEQKYRLITEKPIIERSIEKVDEIRTLESQHYKIWRNRTVPYIFDSSFSLADRQLIQTALDSITNTTCIRFTPRGSHADYVRFAQDQNACYSQVGRSWEGGQQTVSLGYGCLHHGIIVHEVLHTLGLWHEHSRPDRDAYITVMYDNIELEHRFNFQKRSANNTHVELKSLAYDYGSVMHYSNTTFAKDRHSPTIVSKQPLPSNVIMGQRVGLSQGDVDKLNALYRCDVHNCSSPAPPSHGDFIGSDFSVGMSVSFICDPGYLLVGGTTRECMDTGQWSGQPPVCLETQSTDSASYCAFSTNDTPIMCGWQEDHTDDLDWTLQAGPTQSSGTGPDNDHTLMTDDLGGYVYVEASYTHPRDKARLTSPPMAMSGGPVCLVFYAHMHGSKMGNLTVYSHAAGSPMTPAAEVVTLQGDQGDTWRMVMVTLGDIQGDFQITLEASLGTGYLSDIAVDDVIVAYCSSMMPLLARGGLQTTLRCTFDNGLCGLIQDHTDDLDWRVNTGMTNTFNTGPDCDPHNCTHGKYLYLETSTPAHPGDTARLRTPVIGGPGSHCLTFLYHMYGAHMGSLAVTLSDVISGNHMTLWQQHGNHGNQWTRTFVEFTAQGAFEITFTGTKGSGYRSDMGIDTLLLVPGACSGELKFNCSFDRDACGWRNETSLSVYKDWRRHHGYTATPNTGPDGDRNRPLDGSYMMVEASSSYPGDKAALVSPSLTPRAGGACMGFWYHQYGVNAGNLTLSIKQGDSLSEIWSLQGDQGNQWREAKVNLTLTSGGEYQVVFIADLVGFGGYGDVAIDDVTLYPHLCL